MQCNEVLVPSEMGVALRLKVYSPERRLPAFVPVFVAVHDLGMSGDTFAPLMPELALEDRANLQARLRAMSMPGRHPMSRSPNAPPPFIEELYLITYDQRGHGTTADPCAPSSSVDMETLTNDCARVLEYIEANLFRHHQLFLLGHGAGTAVAVGAALRVNRDTQKAVHGLVALRDWLDDAPSFASLSQLASRPPSVLSVDAAVDWYAQRGLLRSRAAACQVVAPLLKPASSGTELEWITTAAALSLDRLIADSVSALTVAAPTFSPPSTVLVTAGDANTQSSLASLMPKGRTVVLAGDPATYYPSVDSSHELVKALRAVVNDANRDDTEPECVAPGRPVMMMPRPGQ